MVTGILAATGGLVALFVLFDLTGFLLVRAGKRPMLGWRRNELLISAFASAVIPDISRGGGLGAEVLSGGEKRFTSVEVAPATGHGVFRCVGRRLPRVM
jgi:hypothetical protein